MIFDKRIYSLTFNFNRQANTNSSQYLDPNLFIFILSNIVKYQNINKQNFKIFFFIFDSFL